MRKLEGKVVSSKSIKTVIVEIIRFGFHPLYGKRVRKNSRLAAHNEMEAKEGDLVRIQECRPVSKTKAWKVIEILKQ